MLVYVCNLIGRSFGLIVEDIVLNYVFIFFSLNRL